MTCQHCTQQHPVYYTYCPNTSKLIEPMNINYTYKTLDFCLDCGAKNEYSGTFCSQCGTSTIQKEEQKTVINKVIAETLKNINAPKVGEMKKEVLKEVSKERIQFFKTNPLFFLPIVLSIVLLFVFTIVLKDRVMDVLEENLSPSEKLVVRTLVDNSNEIKDFLIDELNVENIKGDIPNISINPILITNFHNIKTHWVLQIQEDRNRTETIMDIRVDNLFLGLFVVPLIALVIGGISYGLLARRFHWPLLQGVIYSSIVYVVAMLVMIFLSKMKLDVTMVDYGESSELYGAITYSVLDTVFTSVFLSIVGFGFAAYVAYFNKSILEKLSYQTKYIQYAFFSIAITLVGLFVHFLNVYFSINKRGSIEDLSSGMMGLVKLMSGFYFSVWNWFSSFFAQLTLNFESEFESEQVTYSLVGGNYKYLEEWEDFYFLFEDLTFTVLPPFILILLSLALIVAAGYILYVVHQLNWKEILLFAGIFTLVQWMLMFVTKIQIKGIVDSEYGLIDFSFNTISSCLLILLISFLSFYVGGFIRQYQMKKM